MVGRQVNLCGGLVLSIRAVDTEPDDLRKGHPAHWTQIRANTTYASDEGKFVSSDSLSHPKMTYVPQNM